MNKIASTPPLLFYGFFLISIVFIYIIHEYSPNTDKRGLLAIQAKSEIFTEKERPGCCEQLQKI